MEEKELEKVEEERLEKLPEKKVKKKKHFFGWIINILAFLLLIFVIVEAYLGFIGFNAVKEDKVPEYYVSVETTEDNGSKITTYNFGLFKAQKIEDSKKYSYKLLPFFLD